MFKRTSIIVSVPKKLVNIFNDTRAPSSRFGGNTENSRTKKPAMTTIALKLIALPECAMVFWALSCLFPVFIAFILYCSMKCTA